MSEKQFAPENTEGVEKKEENEKKKREISDGEGLLEQLPEEYRTLVTEAIKGTMVGFFSPEKLEIVRVEHASKPEEVPVLIKIRTHDWLDYFNYEIKINKTPNGWEIDDIKWEGDGPVFPDPKEE